MRILCLGNNTEDTDTRTRNLALKNTSLCHGLLSELEGHLSPDQYSQPGYYHSSVYDVEWVRLQELSDRFDLVIMLDQPKDQWDHPNAWLNTIRLMKKLKTKIQFIDPSQTNDIEYFLDLLEKNKAFCVHPFIQLHTKYSHSVLCCRSDVPVADLDTFENFHDDHNYRSIRNKILQGEKIPHCTLCYNLESKGIITDRINDTIEWVNRLNLKTTADLTEIRQPVFYDIRPSNKCNLTCRMCSPTNSHLIEKEYKKIGILNYKSPANKHNPRFHMIHHENLKQVYIAGGEPTVISEMYQWLDRCVKENHTDFVIELNTNGTNITPRLKKILPHFRQFNFIFSVDAYGDLNRYIRWPTDWSTVIDNWHYLQNRGHPVTLSTTISIYNISKLSKLFEFIDREFPGTIVHPSLVNSSSCMSPFLFPDNKIVLEDLQKVKQTRSYKTLDFMSTVIDDFTNFYSQDHCIDIDALRKFFQFNDKLDLNRSVYLKDYLPELDIARHLVYNQER